MSGLVLSLFPGVDLLGRAFSESGWCVVRGPDPYIWGDVDIRDFHPPAGMWEGIIGGPPCPDFSPLRYLIAAHGYTSRHGNLIPEFERCVAEAQPSWFLMEEGPFAPDAIVPGYAQFGFFLCPTWLGEEQSRRRKFCFGVKGDKAIDLRQFIDYAIFEPMVAQHGVLGDGAARGVWRLSGFRRVAHLVYAVGPYLRARCGDLWWMSDAVTSRRVDAATPRCKRCEKCEKKKEAQS